MATDTPLRRRNLITALVLLAITCGIAISIFCVRFGTPPASQPTMESPADGR